MSNPTDPPIFGYVRLAHRTLIQLYSDKFVPAVQVAYVLGKLLPMGVDIWIGDSIPEDIPDDWIALEITSPEGDLQVADGVLSEALHTRTRGWWTACRRIVAHYHQRWSPELEEVSLVEEMSDEAPVEIPVPETVSEGEVEVGTTETDEGSREDTE